MVVAIQRSTINSSGWQTGNTRIQSSYHQYEGASSTSYHNFLSM